MAAPIMWGDPAPACGPRGWRRCRKCRVIDSRTFKYPPCNKNRLPARRAPRPLPAPGSGARPSRSERRGAERSRPPPGRRARRTPHPHAAWTAVTAPGGFARRRRRRPRNKAVRRRGLPSGRGEGSAGSALAVRPRLSFISCPRRSQQRTIILWVSCCLVVIFFLFSFIFSFFPSMAKEKCWLKVGCFSRCYLTAIITHGMFSCHVLG